MPLFFTFFECKDVSESHFDISLACDFFDCVSQSDNTSFVFFMLSLRVLHNLSLEFELELLFYKNLKSFRYLLKLTRETLTKFREESFLGLNLVKN